MNTIFILLMVASLLAVFVFAIMLVANLLRKKPNKKTTRNTGIATAVFFVTLVGSILTTEVEEKEVADEPTVAKADEKSDAVKQEQPKEKVKEEVKEDPTVKDAEIYKNEIKLHLDAFQGEYDKHWENNWAATFDGVANGTVDAYEAYKNLNSLEKYYVGLGNKTRNTELPKLSKENQKILDAYLSDFRSAILTRSRAAKEAAEMFDLGEFKPSEMDKLKSTVNYADQELMQALVERVKLEQKLGLME